MTNLAIPNTHVYAPNPHRDDAFEDGIIMALNPEMTHAMIDFGTHVDPVIVSIECLEPVCETCGGLRSGECCDDPK